MNACRAYKEKISKTWAELIALNSHFIVVICKTKILLILALFHRILENQFKEYEICNGIVYIQW